MNHDAWSARQTTATLTVDGHDLGVAYYEDGADRGRVAGRVPARHPDVVVPLAGDSAGSCGRPARRD